MDACDVVGPTSATRAEASFAIVPAMSIAPGAPTRTFHESSRELDQSERRP
jgi:hypothetical protein